MASKDYLPLSIPILDSTDAASVARTVSDGWVGPVGPVLSEFEDAIKDYIGASYAVALSSGTAALHLGLKALGVGPGDIVVVPTLTFAATAFAVAYTGAEVALVDVEEDSWNLDPGLLEEALLNLESRGTPAKVVIPVDLYGRTCDFESITQIAHQHGALMLEDAAEALGATHDGHSAGTFGMAGAFSFNGNKILTAGGGGMLVTDDEVLATKVRYWSTQSRSDVHWYEHDEIGYNYRMSSLQAALGLSQLRRFDSVLARRRHILSVYTEALSAYSRISVSPQDPWGKGNAWLTTVVLTTDAKEGALEQVRQALLAEGIETRFLWKPLHQQPVFAKNEHWLSGHADRLFATGLCLPSSANMTDDDVLRVARALVSHVERY